MKYGVHWTARVSEASTIREAAHRAEELGYHSFGLPDHLITSRPIIDPFVGLTIAAEATSEIKLSTMVVLSGLRRSVQLAREIASLQSISGDRVEVGIGAGWVADERAILDRWTGKTPLQRISTDLELLHCAFDNQLDETSKPECLDPDHMLAKSIARNTTRPTFMVAAGGPKMLQIASRLSDIAMITVPTDRRLTGEKPSLELLGEQIAYVTKESPQNTPPQIQFQIREYLPGADSPSSDLWSLRGSHSDIQERLAGLESLGVDYISLCTNNMDVMEGFANDIF